MKKRRKKTFSFSTTLTQFFFSYSWKSDLQVVKVISRSVAFYLICCDYSLWVRSFGVIWIRISCRRFLADHGASKELMNR